MRRHPSDREIARRLIRLERDKIEGWKAKYPSEPAWKAYLPPEKQPK